MFKYFVQSSILGVWQDPDCGKMNFAKRFTLDVWQGSECVNTTMTIRRLLIRSVGVGLLNFFNIIQDISSNIVRSQIHVTLYLTYFLNKENYDTCFVFRNHMFLQTMFSDQKSHHPVLWRKQWICSYLYR